MGTAYGHKIDTNGLLLNYDVANFKSFPGEPTTNLVTDTYLVGSNDWVNSGAYTADENATDVPRPEIQGFDVNSSAYRIRSGVITTAGDVHLGSHTIVSITGGNTYTISVYFRQNRTSSCVTSPYMRQNVNNNNIADFAYNGVTGSSSWPINQWIRITATATTTVGETGLYLSCYLGNAIGDKVWYFGTQIEEKGHVTPLVSGTRSATIYDLSGNGNNGTLTNGPTYNTANGGVISLAGASFQYISTSLNMATSNYTVVGAAKYTNTGGYTGRIFSSVTNNWLMGGWGSTTENYYAVGWVTSGSGDGALDTNWRIIAATGNIAGDSYQMYVNGVSTIGPNANGTAGPNGIQIGGYAGNNEPSDAYFSFIMVYNRVLSSTEILYIYRIMKGRFGL